MNISKNLFGTLSDNRPVHSVLLQNDNNMSIEVLEFGGIVRSMNVPDKDGSIADVVLGYDSLESYLEDKSYFGATVGRVANRIGGA